jgi:hypothetical protein
MTELPCQKRWFLQMTEADAFCRTHPCRKPLHDRCWPAIDSPEHTVHTGTMEEAPALKPSPPKVSAKAVCGFQVDPTLATFFYS